MLILKKIEIENFGPYKGLQSIDISTDPGVTIIYGENMRGKTLLLNAIRFALFGKVLGRGARELSIHQLSNWENAKEGIFGFRVVLHLEFNGINYEITRLCSPKKGILTPNKDKDYVQETYLKRGNKVVSPDELNLELSRIMPEKISRFFLFDGELLQEYEDLLRQESAMGEKIKSSIEKILGVPILLNARLDLKDQVNKASKIMSVAAKKNQETQELGNQIQFLNDQREMFESEVIKAKDEISTLSDQKHQLDELVKQNEKVLFLMQERDKHEKKIIEIDEGIETKKEKLQGLFGNAWLGILHERIQKLKQDYTNELQELEKIKAEWTISSEYSRIYKKAISKEVCPICDKHLNKEEINTIETELDKINPAKENEKNNQQITDLSKKISLLNGYPAIDEIPIIIDTLSYIDEKELDKKSIKDQINDIKERSKDFDQSEQRQLMADSDKVLRTLSLAEDSLEKTEEKHKEICQNIKKLEKKLEQIGGKSMEDEQKLSVLCNDLHDLFSLAVDKYRDKLRENVETDASSLFLELTSEPEYSGLEINENYGLTIIHQDGEPITIRSSGAEHIVALALMGALQKNSPLSGPIIMDSPFGRLDSEHTTKIVSALPTMANQIVMLVYESELDKDLAREILLGKLKKEYKLQKVTAKHTRIESLIQE